MSSSRACGREVRLGTSTTQSRSTVHSRDCVLLDETGFVPRCPTTHVSDNRDVFERNVERVWKAWKRPWPVLIVQQCTQSVTSKSVDRASSYPQSWTDLSEVRGFLMNSVLEARAENWVEGYLGNLEQGPGLGLRVTSNQAHPH